MASDFVLICMCCCIFVRKNWEVKSIRSNSIAWIWEVVPSIRNRWISLAPLHFPSAYFFSSMVLTAVSLHDGLNAMRSARLFHKMCFLKVFIVNGVLWYLQEIIIILLQLVVYLTQYQGQMLKVNINFTAPITTTNKELLSVVHCERLIYSAHELFISNTGSKP